ncbi:hypothetical protein GN316_06000 [Xylophilus sp. Kf1]|nr:hypothetical protein [Xylophilus sp. Kf1]
MKTNSRIHFVSTALALSVAALSFSASAQTSTTPAKGDGPVQRAEDATKRGAKKVGHAVSKGAHKTHDAVENTGEKIGSKLPPAPRDQGLDAQGVKKNPQ